MDISFNCSSCGTHILIDEAGAGMSVQCPKCNQSLTVPTANAVDLPAIPVPSSPVAPNCIYTLFRGRGPSKLTQIIGAPYFYRTPSQTVEGPFNKLEESRRAGDNGFMSGHATMVSMRTLPRASKACLQQIAAL
jgi:predicted Zn finger-like uncharacterized protein